MKSRWTFKLEDTTVNEVWLAWVAAALPYLDGLFAFAGPSDVAELSRQLKRSGPGGRIGYDFDTRSTPRLIETDQ